VHASTALEQTFAGISRTPASFHEPSLLARVANVAEPSMLSAHGRVDTAVTVSVFRERHADCRKRLAEVTGLQREAA
jgi:hypothetical protein